jgi:protein O-mannosyl-transferase
MNHKIRIHPFAIYAILLVVVTFAYANSLSVPFLLDDEPNIINNPRIRQVGSVAHFLNLFRESMRPLGELTFSINYANSRLDVRNYHIFNVVIHLFAGLAFFGLLKNTFASQRLKKQYQNSGTSLAFVITLFWLIHPLQTQSVTYIVQRFESLMGLFYCFTLYSISNIHLKKRKTFWKTMAVCSCFLGMASKEIMATAPILAFLYDRIFFTSSIKEIIKRRKGFYLCLFSSWSVLVMSTLAIMKAQPVGFGSAGFGLQEFTPFQYAITQAGVVLHYLKLSVWPSSLCFDYLWPVSTEISQVALPLFLISALIVVTFISLWHSPAAGFLGIAFFLILAPTSSIMPIADVAAEQRMYLPLACVVTLLVLLGHRLISKAQVSAPFKRNISICLVFAISTTLLIFTISRNNDYKSELSIWQDTVRKRPESTRAHANLGQALHKNGNLNEAIIHYKESIRLHSKHFQPHSNLGIALTSQGKLDEAIHHFKKALEINPNYAVAHSNLGFVYVKQGKLNEAVEEYEQALKIDNQFTQARINLANVLADQNKLDEAKKHLMKVLELEPNHQNARDQLNRLEKIGT